MSAILIIGASGLVGSRFVELHSKKEELLTPDHGELDITNRQSVLEYFTKHQPSVVINFAAYTSVGEADKQRGDKTGECWKLNVDGVQNLLNAMLSSTFFVQISTDYVFSGQSGPYVEKDLPETDSDKVTWYGFAKAEAERLSNGHAILRVVYPVRSKFDKKLDYLRKPLKQYDDGKLLPLFSDQQVSITFIDEACFAIEKIIEKKLNGVFHAGSKDIATPLELVSYLLHKTRDEHDSLKSWSIEEFFATGASPVRYPKLSGLRVEETEEKLGIKFSTWREIIDKLIFQGLGRV